MFAVTTTLCCLGLALPQDPQPNYKLPPQGYHAPEEVAAALEELVSMHLSWDLIQIGTSPEGRPLYVLSIPGPQLAGNPAPGAPAILVVANLEGDRLGAGEVALNLAQNLSANFPLLEKAHLFLMPMANPDAVAHVLHGEGNWRGAPTDNDRDGRVDEDGAHDINGDGQVLWMRVPTPGGQWLAEPKDSRLSRKAKTDDGEAGEFRLLREGADTDGDRLENEDGKGGIQLEANFPHRWQQYDPAAGPYQLSEPESRALVDFVLLHPEICLALVLDNEDNLTDPPQGEDKSTIQSTIPLKADATLIKILRKGWQSEDDQEKVLGEEHQHGNFADWLYFQRGILVLESALWSPPLEMKEEGEAKPKEEAKDLSKEQKLLAWAERWYGDKAFVPWQDFHHPTLGDITIGGWKPLLRTNPPISLIPQLRSRTEAILSSLGPQLAKLSWEKVEVKALDGQQVFEARATLVNPHTMPTDTAMAIANRKHLPLRIYLELPAGGKLLVGKMQQNLRRLEGLGGSHEFHWIFQLPPNSKPAQVRAVSTHSGESVCLLEVQS